MDLEYSWALTTTGGIAFLLGLLLVWNYKNKPIGDEKKNKLPPGPYCLPFFGYLPFITKEPYKKFVELSQRYCSGVIGLYLGNRYSIILNDFPSVKEALFQDACLGRPHGTAFELLPDNISLNDTSGPPWKENRRMTVRILKELGFDKSDMERQAQFEVQEFINIMKSKQKENGIINYERFLISSVSNNITSLVFGERFPFNDNRRHLLDNYITTISSFFKQTSIHACYPWLKKFLYFFKLINYGNAKIQLLKFLTFVQNEIDSHSKIFEENSQAVDYIDGYLKAMAKSNYSYLSVKHLRGNVRSLFGAGTEPVRCTLEWTLLTMAHFKDYQDRVHKELDSVFGEGIVPNMIDSIKAPLTQAVIYEVMRWNSVVPFTHVRGALEDTVIQDCFVPKDTVIFFNLHAVHSDPKLWGDPEVFRPERFINAENRFVRPEYFLPFGLGKRSCPGENMVYIILFIYFATIMQNFSVLPPKNEEISFDANLGIARQAKSTRLRFITRP